MRKGGFIVGGLVALGVYLSYRAWNIKESIRFFEYGINSLKVSLSNILQPEVLFNITVYNPNRTSVPVNEVFGVVKIKGNTISNFKNTEPININGQETKSIPIRARISAISLVATLFTKSAVNNVEIDGMVKTGFFDFPINKIIPIKS